MELRNCKECKKLFVSVSGRTICRDCHEKREKSYDRIIKYLNNNPNASIEDVCKATKVTKDSVIELVKNRKISLSVEYECEICEKKIKVGKICPECKEKVTTELDKVLDKVRKEEGEAKARDLATKFALDLREKKKER